MHYLIIIDGRIKLQTSRDWALESLDGPWCGEWGSHFGDQELPVGINLMLIEPNFLRESAFPAATNAELKNGDLIIYLQEAGLPSAECMPFLPVILAQLPQGPEILILTGFESLNPEL